MAKQKNASKEQTKEVDTSTAKPLYETARTEVNNNPVILYTDSDAEYERLYGWIHKGDVDATLKAILKELVRIRMGGNNV